MVGMKQGEKENKCKKENNSQEEKEGECIFHVTNYDNSTGQIDHCSENEARLLEENDDKESVVDYLELPGDRRDSSSSIGSVYFDAQSEQMETKEGTAINLLLLHILISFQG